MKSYMSYIDKFCTSISQYVIQHPEHQYAVCRGSEIHKLLKVLTDYPIKYPVLVGDSYAERDLIRGLARKISIGDLDAMQDVYRNSGLYKVNWNQLARDEHEYSDFKKLLKQCVSWAALHSSSEYNVIVIIDGHILKDAHLRKILKPFISEGLIQIIFDFTDKEYEHYIKPRHWFTKRIAVLYVHPLVMEQMIQAIAVNIPGYEMRYGIKIPSNAINTILDYCIDDNEWMTSHTVRAFKLLDLSCKHAKRAKHFRCLAADVKYALNRLNLK